MLTFLAWGNGGGWGCFKRSHTSITTKRPQKPTPHVHIFFQKILVSHLFSLHSIQNTFRDAGRNYLLSWQGKEPRRCSAPKSGSAALPRDPRTGAGSATSGARGIGRAPRLRDRESPSPSGICAACAGTGGIAPLSPPPPRLSHGPRRFSPSAAELNPLRQAGKAG